MTKKRKFNVTHIENANRLLPKAFDGFTIALISDLHNRVFKGGMIHPSKAVREVLPDIIAVPGDIIDRHNPDVDGGIDFIKRMTDIAPVYFSPGNHEFRSGRYEKLSHALAGAGVHILDDTSETLERGGERITIAGLRDPAFFNDSSGRADGETLQERETALRRLVPDDESFTLLLSHRPELLPVYARCNVSLALSGHAHGGQVYVPGIGGLYSPGQGVFPKYTRGLHTLGGTTMIVSRGIGGRFYHLRPFNRPEIVVMKLRNY